MATNVEQLRPPGAAESPIPGAEGGRWQRLPHALPRLTARPRRLTVVTAASRLVAGIFTFLRWDVRLPARRRILPWYPLATWVD